MSSSIGKKGTVFASDLSSTNLAHKASFLCCFWTKSGMTGDGRVSSSELGKIPAIAPTAPLAALTAALTAALNISWINYRLYGICRKKNIQLFYKVGLVLNFFIKLALCSTTVGL
jgi:hypothetical protein